MGGGFVEGDGGGIVAVAGLAYLDGVLAYEAFGEEHGGGAYFGAVDIDVGVGGGGVDVEGAVDGAWSGEGDGLACEFGGDGKFATGAAV